jgi:hypothetical protein
MSSGAPDLRGNRESASTHGKGAFCRCRDVSRLWVQGPNISRHCHCLIFVYSYCCCCGWRSRHRVDIQQLWSRRQLLGLQPWQHSVSAALGIVRVNVMAALDQEDGQPAVALQQRLPLRKYSLPPLRSLTHM